MYKNKTCTFRCKNRIPEKTVKVHIHQTLYRDTALSKHYQKVSSAREMCLNTQEKQKRSFTKYAIFNVRTISDLKVSK